MPRLISIPLTVLLTAATLSVVPTSTASVNLIDRRVISRLDGAINALPVAIETRQGYAREKFRHWVDVDSDCQDARDEVLAIESLTKVSGCDIQTGSWRSWYDGVTTASSTEFDIDHMVPLAEAWDSGAKRWNAITRERFANDLRDHRSLVAVTASSNRTKSDRDPAEWMPAQHRCRYVQHWVAVKIRWQLTVDRTEKRALLSLSGGCANTTIVIAPAVITLGGSGSGGGGGGGGDGGDLDPRFDYCYQAQTDGYGPYYRGSDPEYEWYTDADSDGVVCE